jgi:hypothetical protein
VATGRREEGAVDVEVMLDEQVRAKQLPHLEKMIEVGTRILPDRRGLTDRPEVLAALGGPQLELPHDPALRRQPK